jgi:hypothetical protein
MGWSRYYVFGNGLSEPTIFVIVVNSGESSMKSLAYVFAAVLALAIAAPSLVSARGMHHHHHHHHHMMHR